MSDLYEAQRAMRAMRRAAIQRGVVAILDVGTSKIAGMKSLLASIAKMPIPEQAPVPGGR